MKRIDKEPAEDKVDTNETDYQKEPVDKLKDFQRLVHLLRVHQIELQHQNEELRITQDELEVSRNKYVSLFDFSPIPYFTLNENGMIEEVNLTAANMIEIDRKKIIGKSLNTYINLGEREIFNNFIKTVFTSKIKQSCELVMINQSKKLFNVLLEAIVLNDPLEAEQKCQVAVINLTPQKNIENSLIETNDELKILNVYKDKFFAIIAHDLRNPFQSLLGYSELLSTGIENLSHDHVKTFGSELNTSIKNLFGLLENLLKWSMLQRNILEFKPEKLKLLNAINTVIETLNIMAKQKNISLSCNIKKEMVVYSDADLLRSILQNLIVNAIKFTRAGGKVTVSASRKRGVTEVSVEDNGVGMKPEKINEIFNFQTIYSTQGTEGEKGTGLGLPLSKEFVEKQGGKIWIESELGKGTKITFTLKIKKS